MVGNTNMNWERGSNCWCNQPYVKINKTQVKLELNFDI